MEFQFSDLPFPVGFYLFRFVYHSSPSSWSPDGFPFAILISKQEKWFHDWGFRDRAGSRNTGASSAADHGLISVPMKFEASKASDVPRITVSGQVALYATESGKLEPSSYPALQSDFRFDLDAETERDH